MTAIEAAERLARAARHAGRALFDLVLPPTCPTCDAPVGAQGLMCAECFQSITLLTEPLCRRCGVPFPHDLACPRSRLCAACEASPPAFDRARAPLLYDTGSERLILPLKYADRTELAGVLALHMARAGGDLLRTADLLVPVPLHRRRLFARRYNQAALIAHSLSRRSGRPTTPDALARRRATASLGQMSAAERAVEVADAFAVRTSRIERIRGRRILLIDDVLTSGATANACAQALKAAGATAVDVLAAARVPDPRLQ